MPPTKGNDPEGGKQPPETPPANPTAGQDPEPTPGGGQQPDDGDKGNLKKALDAERYNAREEKRKRKEAEDKLAEYESEKKQREEANMKRKGEYEKLEETLKKENESLKAQNADLVKFREDYEEKAKANIDKLKEGLNDESKTFVDSLLDGKTLQEQENLLPQLVEKFKVPGNINTPPQGGNPPAPEKQKAISDLEAKIEEAKKNKDAKEHLRLSGELQKLKQQA